GPLIRTALMQLPIPAVAAAAWTAPRRAAVVLAGEAAQPAAPCRRLAAPAIAGAAVPAAHAAAAGAAVGIIGIVAPGPGLHPEMVQPGAPAGLLGAAVVLADQPQQG